MDGLVTSTRNEDSGQLVSVEDNTGITNYIYDETTNEFLGIDYSNGGSLRYQYDNLSRITGVSVKANENSETYTTAYEYDGVGNLVKVTDPNNGETVMVYDRLNRLTSRSLPNGVTSTYDYQVNTDWVAKITHTATDGTVLASTEYIREGAGEPVKIIREDGSYVEVDYDDSLRVIKETYFDSDDNQTEEIVYTYDESGNRATVSSGEAAGTYNYDNIHSLIGISTATGEETYTRDAGGRIKSITRDGETWNIEYNTADLITLITDSQGNVVVEYTYDSNGRRIEATDSTGSRDYLVAPMGNTELESPHIITNDNGDLISAYVYGGAMPLMRLDENGNPVYYLTDAMGSVIGLADGLGVEVADFRYDSFGNLRSSTGVEGVREALAGGDFRFQGQWLESTTDLYNFRARYYDPESGRFVSRDPVEIIEYEPESSNPYQFVYHNPLIMSDPSGEFTISEFNASFKIQNILNQVQAQAANAVKDYLVDQVKGIFANALNSYLKTILPAYPVGIGTLNTIQFLQDNQSYTTAGNLFDLVAQSAFGFIFKEMKLDDWVWFEPRIVVSNGKAVSSGYNPSVTNVVQQNILKFGNYNGPPGSTVIPDFIISKYSPLDNSFGHKDLITGDFKISGNTLHSQYINNAYGKRTQWLGIARHAKYENQHQFIPLTFFVTLYPLAQPKKKDIEQEAINQKVTALIFSFFP